MVGGAGIAGGEGFELVLAGQAASFAVLSAIQTPVAAMAAATAIAPSECGQQVAGAATSS